jgi:hypothetical protein
MGQALNGERNPKVLHSSNRNRSRSRRDSCGTVVAEVVVMEEEENGESRDTEREGRGLR